MVVVAVAGGTGGVGKTILEQLQLSKKHEVILLSRKAPITPASGGAKIVLADYGNIEALSLLLEKHNVETVISTIGFVGPEAAQSQLNLIAAADKAKSTRRFVPSEFGVWVSPDDTNAAVFGAWLDAIAALKKTGLMYTRVINGWFMDYFGMPHTPSNLHPHTWAVDIANRRAAIPGTGNEPMTLTYSVDVARFVVRMLDDTDWPEVSIISGSDTTFNEILGLAEKLTGAKFDVVYDGEEKLRNGQATIWSAGYGAGPASMEETQAMIALFGLMSVEGRILVPEGNRLNAKYPDIRPTGIEELLTKAWAGK
ncbi:hypothetical protein HER10_EVM0003012 [Colletotrichum scovillei]|uniref:NmrA-like family protein n=1 Tax=Colletotrichum scovillei TaxID=1209932 RepID=A0A9P7QZD6_9PEZI|nr:uncharacterized protein HER10_EVM0003012 [Colletotrichum scovillei]KAF4780825.1 hypothetical protein HER10_EVM0003012 [Colletotrichum scovillei]KAG7045359.1 nmrA-like family protein [Colletotrichum scovillei]KAG7052521.1 nmrA-like family protein [Colletotrichum scovillei]KAG7064813.1 nmrA-like family protein [Colletotrichum scovillei]